MAGRFKSVAKSMGHLVYVDCSAIVSRLEGQGAPRKQAEALTEAIIDIATHSAENISDSITQKVEHHLAVNKEKVDTNQREFQSWTRHEIDRLRSDLDMIDKKFGFELDKAKAESQVKLESTKSSLIKYYLATALSVGGVVLGYMSWKKN